MRPIYLDHNATTPLDPEVLEAMRPHWLSAENPESRHFAGRAARRAWESSKATVARILNADPSEVVFTSGGTESNNLAIFGLAAPERGAGRVVSSPIEHPAVAEPIRELERLGFLTDRPDVDSLGVANADAMAAAIRFDTRLLTLMLANNETGALQPVAALVERASEFGLPVHTDAVQAVGRIPTDFRALGVATLSASAHKFHGPAGVGLLLVRSGTTLSPRTFGGAQQGGRRPGTPPVALAVGLAAALSKWNREQSERIERWRVLSDRLLDGLTRALGSASVVLNGPSSIESRLPQTVNLAFPGLDADALLMQLDLSALAVSLGSACSSGTTLPSPTLVAMNVPADRLRSSVRFSLGADTREQDIDEAVDRVIRGVRRISAAESIDPSS